MSIFLSADNTVVPGSVICCTRCSLSARLAPWSKSDGTSMGSAAPLNTLSAAAANFTRPDTVSAPLKRSVRTTAPTLRLKLHDRPTPSKPHKPRKRTVSRDRVKATTHQW